MSPSGARVTLISKSGDSMRTRTALITAACMLMLIGTAFAISAPRAWREYPARENNNDPLPEDAKVPGEWVFARLMYPQSFGGRGYGRRFGGGGGSSYKEGYSSWTTDYPAADRHLSTAIRRLTRIQTRSVEQPIDLDDVDDVFNYPFLYAVEVGHWNLTDDQAKRFREFLDRGGFFMCDDFHGTYEWQVFLESMKRVYPDREIVDIPDSDAIFHTVFDLEHRPQVPGAQYLRSGRTYEQDGYEPRWRGIYDDKGRLTVAICHNMDLGDAWQWADEPRYDEKFSATAFRIATNYVVYSMTH